MKNHMPKWVYIVLGLSFSIAILAIAYRIFIGSGGGAKIGPDGLELNVLPARTELKIEPDKIPPEEEVTPDSVDMDSVDISSASVALVFDPPSNIRVSPNGEIVCSVTSKGSIRIYNEVDGWYRTNACGVMGVIHRSQISFDPNSIK